MTDTKVSIFDQDLPQTPANHAPMSPLSFIERTAEVYPTRLAIVHGELRQDWATTYRRSRQLASALTKAGIGKIQISGCGCRKLLQAAPEIVSQVANQPANKRQLKPIRKRRLAKSRELLPESLEKTFGGLSGLRLQCLLGPGADDVVASALSRWPASIQ